jgi:hypothetical protein
MRQFGQFFDIMSDKNMEDTMKKTFSKILIGLFCFGMLNLAAERTIAPQIKKFCCVAGKYQGFQIHYAKPNCPAPEKEKFSMEILQKEFCGAEVWGTITDSSGLVSNWKGKLTKGLRNCCQIEGIFLPTSGNTVTFKGTLCQKGGHWQGKGTWVENKSTDPCKGSGTWEMSQ